MHKYLYLYKSIVYKRTKQILTFSYQKKKKNGKNTCTQNCVSARAHTHTYTMPIKSTHTPPPTHTHG